jgi:hypothetical protein
MSNDYEAAGAYRRPGKHHRKCAGQSRFFHAAPHALIVKQRRANS